MNNYLLEKTLEESVVRKSDLHIHALLPWRSSGNSHQESGVHSRTVGVTVKRTPVSWVTVLTRGHGSIFCQNVKIEWAALLRYLERNDRHRSVRNRPFIIENWLIIGNHEVYRSPHLVWILWRWSLDIWCCSTWLTTKWVIRWSQFRCPAKSTLFFMS